MGEKDMLPDGLLHHWILVLLFHVVFTGDPYCGSYGDHLWKLGFNPMIVS
jgi:hypothetical protein